MVFSSRIDNGETLMTMRTNRKDFETLENILKRFEAKGRNSSAAFLIWFLRTIYRMDDVEAEDAVCDATDDGGIDGLITDDDLKEIVLFQGKRRERLPATRRQI
jgi:restriction endonuclease Mrr